MLPYRISLGQAQLRSKPVILRGSENHNSIHLHVLLGSSYWAEEPVSVEVFSEPWSCLTMGQFSSQMIQWCAEEAVGCFSNIGEGKIRSTQKSIVKQREDKM